MPRAGAGVEQQIADQVSRGDLREAATIAITIYGPDVLGYLCALLRDEDDGADAFSLFCEDVWKGIGRFRSECSLKTWAYKLAWNAAMRVTRDLFRNRGRRLQMTEISHIAARVRSTTPLHLRQSASDDLDRLRQRLTPAEQTLLILRIDRRLSWNEVAVVLSTDTDPLDGATVRKRFERLKARLRTMADEEGMLGR